MEIVSLIHFIALHNIFLVILSCLFGISIGISFIDTQIEIFFLFCFWSNYANTPVLFIRHFISFYNSIRSPHKTIQHTHQASIPQITRTLLLLFHFLFFAIEMPMLPLLNKSKLCVCCFVSFFLFYLKEAFERVVEYCLVS